MPSRRSARTAQPPPADEEPETPKPRASRKTKASASPNPPNAAPEPPAKKARASRAGKGAGGAPTSTNFITAPSPGSKASLAGNALPKATAIAGKLDAGVATLDPPLAARASLHTGADSLVRDARLALVEPAKKKDKYYVLQLIEDNQTSSKRFHVFWRRGRTGTAGQCKLDGPMSASSAEARFDKLFTAKTGYPWGTPLPQLGGHYAHLHAPAAPPPASSAAQPMRWQYWLTADPLGKPDGWYDYDDANSAQVEQLWLVLQTNPSVSERFVTSDTSGYSYCVDLAALTQRNTTSHMTRQIRRVAPGAPPPSTAPPLPAGHAPTPTRTPASSVAPTPPRAAPVASLARQADVLGDPCIRGGRVVDECDALLNQTDIANNNNKFIRAQVVRTAAGCFFHRRWGRVGENGQFKTEGPMLDEEGVRKFTLYFRTKTGWAWDERQTAPATPRKGKYSLVDMEGDEAAARRQLASTGAPASAPGAAAPRAPRTLPCALAPATLGLIELIFERETFESAMSALEIDPARLPLGALSHAQLEKGERALEAVEAAIARRAPAAELEDLSAAFYTCVPHAFGRARPPALRTQPAVAAKFELLNVLRDIDEGNRMAEAAAKASAAAAASGARATVAHPADDKYATLACTLEPLAGSDPELALIRQYVSATGPKGPVLLSAWRAERHGEAERFRAYDQLANRRLLWHGTNVAVVAAILKSGLRIMPHSGGRVGRGIYLADMQEKSASYVRAVPARQGSGQRAIMFLVEAALGAQHEVTRDGPHASGLSAAPSGFDSVLARGTHAPDAAFDQSLSLDGREVQVPQGPVRATGVASSFQHNEFLVYNEGQHRIRYVLLFDWGH